MQQSKPSKIEKSVIETCVYLYTELSSMKPDPDHIYPSVNDIVKMDPLQALSLINNELKDLLKIKRDFMLMDEFENYQNTDQYHKALQKLEDEVRNHIKIEQQLKLHIENTQQKLLDSENARLELASTSKTIIEKLKKDADRPTHRREESSPLTTSRSSNSEIRHERKLTQEISTLKMNMKKDSLKIAELIKDKKRLELQVAMQKSQPEMKKIEKSKENRSESANCVTDFYKKKFEEKCEQVAQLEKQIRMLRTRASDHSFNYIERRRNSYTQKELVSKTPIKEEKSSSNLRSASPLLSKSQIGIKCTSVEKSPKPLSASQVQNKTKR
ncbi:unnamed protein product [Blepharisma stoltei]|uniref:Uncharacterized protein n=1 Tax=Blepharisma stoltei TaxID=1481888 RepID=A0AAU9K7V0_9CILI|nr:unnamed protein product [Blepharisma stoltei]